MKNIQEKVGLEIVRIIEWHANRRAEQLTHDPSCDYARYIQSWKQLKQCTSGCVSHDDISKIITDILVAYTNSLCAMLQGGTRLADSGVFLELRDSHGERITEEVKEIVLQHFTD